MSKPVYIYILIDPNNNEVRYVGRSVNPKKRFRRHLKEARDGTRSHKKAWIRSLLMKEQKPLLKVVECVPPELKWEPREQYWIVHYRRNGANLTNMTQGGDGSIGRIPWNKGSKGIMKANSGSFKPGERSSPDTEIKPGQRLSPSTEFKKGQIPYNAKKVEQLTLDGSHVAMYNSFADAARVAECTPSAISKAARCHYVCRGFRWRNYSNE